MRTRLFLLAASVTSIAAAAGAQGCGEEEPAAAQPSSDAGVDVVDAAQRDVQPAPVDSGPPCDTTADFTKDIPDAAIADGASTTGICVGCAKVKCKTFVDECTANCECQELAGEALECFAKSNGDVLSCLGQFVSANPSKQTQQTGLGLFSCLQQDCTEECQTDAFTPDAGGGDASDGG